jgi:peptide/nickel transport system substrate-binding protein
VENKTRVEIGSLISSDLRKVGIAATCQQVEFNTLVTQLNDTFSYEACYLAFGGSVHPITSMNMWRSSGRTHYWNPLQKTPATPWEAKIDKLADEFVAALDFPSQQKIFFEMQQTEAENLPTLPLFISRTFQAGRNTFGNLRPSALGPIFWNVEEIYKK